MSPSTETRITGAFVFRHDGDGCITGKYFNNGMEEPLPESAKLVKDGKENSFEGLYSTTWLNDINQHEKTFLRIKPRDKAKGIYAVTWSEDKADSKPKFSGEAMLVNGLLVGWYIH